ncbi:MAG: succinate-semialdehyde dehydrogenase [Piscirickettsiaceae bacterium CG_4_9_14_3_um_filter_43_564]|nr:NAD-dependent succinate-semialdehyde dehydrogenase [Thiomicrospira sp.]OIP94619.1 MAG: succinate-semialdehyde dehydrogenase [Thiomicrospira sp. CG2_30_44_34]PIQ03553.1 MAG: succinate-semialdehyde dehydrogenase [Piscirickettsiaceae bacterium CG18_big_fil_WC_8_21_14_2_50_44_103]PIU38073.1 MAG: succinate-semialdehyde dehydrogenase [Piscirickettsiaceae bacterium CG07_land_8_20_14_0_80_44_28]PIW77257.1 MAG: succinate-semialdehyde dehydrogenase [Piscirickettsiaceae bacterium CG_4_8_14_3_um_filter_
MTMQSINPATGELNAEFETWNQDTLDEVVTQAGYGFADWSKLTPLEDRIALLRRLGDVLLEDQEPLAELMTLEMGKLYTEALAEVQKCATLCDYYADHAAEFLADEMIESDASKSYLAYLPLGVVLGVMPWNYPFWQVIRFAVPTITAGNIALLKHASNVPQCALALQEVFRKAGYPQGVFTTLMIGSDKVASVIRHPAVKAVSLTGSEAAGRKVAAVAGEQLKKTVLELGGSDAFIVLDSADLKAAVAGAVKGRFLNAGQSCIAAKRFIVDAALVETFTEQFKQTIEQGLLAGDPMKAETTLAPMARQDLLDELHQQVMKSVEMGAKIVTGGYQLDRPGAYYAPTILTNVSSGMPAFDEEFFGPVAIILKASEPAHALGLANGINYGLGGSIWSNDMATAETMARGMESGATFINSPTFSDPRLPFGGVKNSGYGRELSAQGIREFTNIKTVWIK